MGLRGKIIGLFLIVFGLMALSALFVLKNNLANGFLALEQKQTVRKMQQLTRNLNGEIERLNQLAYVWAGQDVRSAKEFEVRQPGGLAFGAIDVQLFAIFDAQGQTLFSQSLDPATGETGDGAVFGAVVEDIKKLAAHAGQAAEKNCGIEVSSVGPLLVCWQPMRNGDQTGHAADTIVIGRLFNAGLINRIQAQANIRFELTPLQVGAAEFAVLPKNTFDAQQVAFSATEPEVLNGVLVNAEGLPILKVRLPGSDDLSRRGAELTWDAARLLWLVMLLAGAALLSGVYFMVIRGLRKMDRDLGSIWRNGRWAGRLESPSKKDELNDLSHAINRLLALIRKQTVMLETIAHTDGLTQIANRRAFDERIAIEMSLHKRNHTELSLLVVDVDYFRRYNDCYGQPAGDLVLKTLGNLLSSIACRPSDLPARIGNEEFAVILPATDLDGACHVAELLSSKLAELKIDHADSPISDYVTLCIGVTSAGDEDVATFVQRADKAMYNAKQTGRNKICLMSPV